MNSFFKFFNIGVKNNISKVIYDWEIIWEKSNYINVVNPNFGKFIPYVDTTTENLDKFITNGYSFKIEYSKHKDEYRLVKFINLLNSPSSLKIESDKMHRKANKKLASFKNR